MRGRSRSRKNHTKKKTALKRKTRRVNPKKQSVQREVDPIALQELKMVSYLVLREASYSLLDLSKKRRYLSVLKRDSTKNVDLPTLPMILWSNSRHSTTEKFSLSFNINIW